MNSWVIAVITFVCVFGGSLSGMWLQGRLKRSHLTAESKTSVTLVTSLMATLSALVLGLLISSSKTTFDTVGEKLRESSAKTVLIDRLLAQYGPCADETRAALREAYIQGIEIIHPLGGARGMSEVALHGSLAANDIEQQIRALPAESELQRTLNSRALELSYEIRLARWSIIEAADSAIPPLFLAVLISWLTAMFIGFGMFAPRNRVSLVALAIGAMSMATSIFLVEEMSHPLSGIITISKDPMLRVLDVLGK
jgi:hypothetical protein